MQRQKYTCMGFVMVSMVFITSFMDFSLHVYDLCDDQDSPWYVNKKVDLRREGKTVECGKILEVQGCCVKFRTDDPACLSTMHPAFGDANSNAAAKQGWWRITVVHALNLPARLFLRHVHIIQRPWNCSPSKSSRAAWPRPGPVSWPLPFTGTWRSSNDNEPDKNRAHCKLKKKKSISGVTRWISLAYHRWANKFPKESKFVFRWQNIKSITCFVGISLIIKGIWNITYKTVYLNLYFE